MVPSRVTYRKDLIETAYNNIYEKPDHMAREVVDECIRNLKELSYIAFKKIDDNWYIYIKNELDFLLPGENEKYMKIFNISTHFKTFTEIDNK